MSSDDSTDAVVDAAYDLAEAYAAGPGRAQNSIPQLMEALKKHDEERYRERFNKGVDQVQEQQ